jgi:hypothetical protein
MTKYGVQSIAVILGMQLIEETVLRKFSTKCGVAMIHENRESGGGERGFVVRLIKPYERSRSNFPTNFLPL